MSGNKNENPDRQTRLEAGAASAVASWIVPASFAGAIALIGWTAGGISDLAGDQRVLAQRIVEHDRRIAASDRRAEKFEREIDRLAERCRVGEVELGRLRYICQSGRTPRDDQSIVDPP